MDSRTTNSGSMAISGTYSPFPSIKFTTFCRRQPVIGERRPGNVVESRNRNVFRPANDLLRRVPLPFHRVLARSLAARRSYQLVHLEGVRPDAGTIVLLAHEMFALMSVYCQIGVSPQRLSISIYRSCLSSFCNFAVVGIDD